MSASVIFPDFIIVGAMRAGTTTLYNLLQTHPDISMSRKKETDFFVKSKNWKHGQGWYSQQFDAEKPIRGEASPNYTKCTVFKGVPERIRELCPDVKIIYVVRDPVARAVSHFNHMQVHRPDKISPDGSIDEHHYQLLRDTSAYALQIKPYVSQFPRENILILDFDLLSSDVQGAMDKVCDFIDAKRLVVKEQVIKNSSAALNKIPQYAISLSRHPLVQSIPPEMREWVKKRLVRRSSSRTLVKIDPEIPKRLKRDLQEDIIEFQTITEHRFPSWSL